jgi:YHS domain-containing protein
MIRLFSTGSIVSVLMVGLASAALAATGEYENMDAMALTQGKAVKTDCSISSQLEGKTYCFGSQTAMTQFMQHPRKNVRKAQAAYQTMR